MSDSLIATSAERLFDTNVSLIYGGQPYYDVIAIDSIYIGWETKKPIKYSVIERHYKKFFTVSRKRQLLEKLKETIFLKRIAYKLAIVFLGFCF